jgi:hypothetical protein
MKMYARIQDGVVAELLRTDGDISTMFHSTISWVDVSSEVGISDGWSFDGKNFTPQTAVPTVERVPTIPELQAQIAAISAQLAALSKPE